jgi:tetraacyldisaccharide 4'-kinase
VGLQTDWYRPTLTWRTTLLIPAAQIWAFWAQISQKKRCTQHDFPCVIIAIGNVTVGGTGKTPLTLFLANALRAQGIEVGIVSRGYPASPASPIMVSADANAKDVGDEPLLYAQAGFATCVCAQRVSSVRKLLETAPQVQVILADDALQHYALPRDMEIGVIDGARKFGNGQFLPAGPLRESPDRLQLCDAVVVNGGDAHAYKNNFSMHVEITSLRTLAGEAHTLAPNTPVTLLAAIGNPERFFAEMARFAPQGLVSAKVSLPDHSEIAVNTLNAQATDIIVVTEKDAVKIAQSAPQVQKKILVAHTAARVSPDLVEFVIERINALKKNRGPKTA